MSNSNEKKAAEIFGKVAKIAFAIVIAIIGKKKFGGGNNSGQQKA